MQKLVNLGPVTIQKYQKNRYPFLMVDYVSEVIPGEYAKGYKNFTYNEWFFPIHFDDDPVVPASIQIEMMAQMFLMTFQTLPGYENLKTSLVSVEKAYFKRKIVPGERVDIEAYLDNFRHGIAKGHVKACVGEVVTCGAHYVITLPNTVKNLLPDRGE